MGASVSKSKESKSSFATLRGNTAKLSSFCVRVESTKTTISEKKEKYNSKKNRKNKNVTKSIISRPTEFIHLNHAGVDYTTLDTIFMSTEQAQKIHITTANTNYATDHSYHSTRLRIDEENNNIKEKIKLESEQKQKLIKSYRQPVIDVGGAGRCHHQIHYNTLRSEELYNIKHDNTLIIQPEMRMATAF